MKNVQSKIVSKIIENYQFCFQIGNICGLTKTVVIIKVKNKRFNIILFIDIKKVYNSVDLEILKKNNNKKSYKI